MASNTRHMTSIKNACTLKKCHRRLHLLPNELLSELVDWLPMAQLIGSRFGVMRSGALNTYLDRKRRKYEKAAFGGKLRVFSEINLQHLKADVLVHFCNDSNILSGGEVFLDVHGLAGPDLKNFCVQNQSMGIGNCHLSNSYGLSNNFKKIAHTILPGPVQGEEQQQQRDEYVNVYIMMCYQNALNATLQAGHSSVVFTHPLLYGDHYGVAMIVGTTLTYLLANSPVADKLEFASVVCPNAKIAQCYTDLIQRGWADFVSSHSSALYSFLQRFVGAVLGPTGGTGGGGSAGTGTAPVDRPTPAKAVELCAVCEDKASGQHYGKVPSCQGCQAFFKRYIKKQPRPVYVCKQNKQCPVTITTRIQCKECRLQKCQSVGVTSADESASRAAAAERPKAATAAMTSSYSPAAGSSSPIKPKMLLGKRTTLSLPDQQQLTSAADPHQLLPQQQEQQQTPCSSSGSTQPKQPKLTVAAELPMPVAEDQQQQSSSRNTAFPAVWQLVRKNADALIKTYKLYGNELLVERMNTELGGGQNEEGIPVLRINQRMRLDRTRLENLTRKMDDAKNNLLALLCLPCGWEHVPGDLAIQTQKMHESFIEYLRAKDAAGIVTSTSHQLMPSSQSSSSSPSLVLHLFPPGHFSRMLLSRRRDVPDNLRTVVEGDENPAYLLAILCTPLTGI